MEREGIRAPTGAFLHTFSAAGKSMKERFITTLNISRKLNPTFLEMEI